MRNVAYLEVNSVRIERDTLISSLDVSIVYRRSHDRLIVQHALVDTPNATLEDARSSIDTHDFACYPPITSSSLILRPITRQHLTPAAHTPS